ncbi:MAG: J domain-containing protein [Candidatus Sumerlaeia bacterium]
MSIQKKVYERVLNMAQMHNIGVLHRGSNMVWTCRWNEGGTESSICYQMLKSPYDKSLKLRLRYKILDDKGQRLQLVDYTVPIKVSLSYKRKVWYWFVCPLTINGKPCGRRVRNIYFLPSSNYFGCKHCRDMMLRSLPVSEQFSYKRTQFLTMEEAKTSKKQAGVMPELRLGWRPQVTRQLCHECGCLSEGAFCCNCGKGLGDNGDQNFFELLGVETSAGEEDINVAFKARLKEYHPDRVAHLGHKIREVAEREIKLINEAYETLRNPEKRAAYRREVEANMQTLVGKK